MRSSKALENVGYDDPLTIACDPLTVWVVVSEPGIKLFIYVKGSRSVIFNPEDLFVSTERYCKLVKIITAQFFSLPTIGLSKPSSALPTLPMYY